MPFQKGHKGYTNGGRLNGSKAKDPTITLSTAMIKFLKMQIKNFVPLYERLTPPDQLRFLELLFKYSYPLVPNPPIMQNEKEIEE